MNLNIWELVKKFWKWLFKDNHSKQITDALKEASQIFASPKVTEYDYIRVKKGKRRYVLKFTQTTKQVPHWIRRKNLGRLTQKEMPCIT